MELGSWRAAVCLEQLKGLREQERDANEHQEISPGIVSTINDSYSGIYMHEEYRKQTEERAHCIMGGPPTVKPFSSISNPWAPLGPEVLKKRLCHTVHCGSKPF